MLGSEKQVSWALSIQNKVIWMIANNPAKFPLSDEMIGFYKEIQDASWWINNRQKLAMPEYILVYGLVSLVQYKGMAEACDEVVRLQDDEYLAPIFNEFKVEEEEC